MNWRNVRLIYAREIRDQLRDRRTLFMIAVLPLLLYPLLGMSIFQVTQFVRKSEPKVLVIGSDELADSTELPELFKDKRFATRLFDDPASASWLHVEFLKGDAQEQAGDGVTKVEPSKKLKETADAKGLDQRIRSNVLKAAEQRLRSGELQVVLNFPPDFGERLHELRSRIKAEADDNTSNEIRKNAAAPIAIPEPQILYNSGKEKSRVAHAQVERLLNTWKGQIVRENLLASRVPMSVAKPFELRPHDVAERDEQQALMWSKILPFVLFIWALTGAFYPAVDLCAGEKERGTLETLLSSPALRTEIVWGKLLTVMTFSAATALLNLASIGFTARFVISQLSLMPTGGFSGLEFPPLGSAMWLLVALLPMSALFSALCLALAAFARSTKEGQYYLMPLLLVTMPLMMLPLAPGTELNLGNSLIPVTGVVLLVMSLVQGSYAEALRYCVPVCVVTLICCHWAIRWAVYQFNQESVLFRESERLAPKRWLVHLIRDRRDTPSLPEAFFCVALIFVLQFFTQLAISSNQPAVKDFGYLTLIIFISQVVCVALPALLMTLLLTGSPRKTLLLDRLPSLAACGIGVLLAVLCHPLGLQISSWIRELYPINDAALGHIQSFTQLLKTAPYPWMPYVLLGLLPPLCEETAFRGFILSGLRHVGSKWWAIGLSAVFFGMAHGVIQQSLSAAVLGMVIGYIAVQTGNLVPCILFHLTYNGLMFATVHLPGFAESRPALRVLFHQPSPSEILYNWPITLGCAVIAIVPLAWLHRLPYQATREEQISDARARQPHLPVPERAG